MCTTILSECPSLNMFSFLLILSHTHAVFMPQTFLISNHRFWPKWSTSQHLLRWFTINIVLAGLEGIKTNIKGLLFCGHFLRLSSFSYRNGRSGLSTHLILLLSLVRVPFRTFCFLYDAILFSLLSVMGVNIGRVYFPRNVLCGLALICINESNLINLYLCRWIQWLPRWIISITFFLLHVRFNILPGVLSHSISCL